VRSDFRFSKAAFEDPVLHPNRVARDLLSEAEALASEYVEIPGMDGADDRLASHLSRGQAATRTGTPVIDSKVALANTTYRQPMTVHFDRSSRQSPRLVPSVATSRWIAARVNAYLPPGVRRCASGRQPLA